MILPDVNVLIYAFRAELGPSYCLQTLGRRDRAGGGAIRPVAARVERRGADRHKSSNIQTAELGRRSFRFLR